MKRTGALLRCSNAATKRSVKGRARIAILSVLLAAGAVGCGQQGPLVLPDSARPIERADPASGDTEQDEDEQQNER